MRIKTVYLMLVVAFMFSGCKTFLADSYIKANMREGYSNRIDSLYVLINKDGIPDEFLGFYTGEISNYFKKRNVKLKINSYDELNLNKQFTKQDFAGYNYLLQINCIRSYKVSYSSDKSTGLDMKASLTNLNDDQIIMRSNIFVGKGYGIGFGETEAKKSFGDLAKKSFDKLTYN